MSDPSRLGLKGVWSLEQSAGAWFLGDGGGDCCLCGEGTRGRAVGREHWAPDMAQVDNRTADPGR